MHFTPQRFSNSWNSFPFSLFRFVFIFSVLVADRRTHIEQSEEKWTLNILTCDVQRTQTTCVRSHFILSGLLNCCSQILSNIFFSFFYYYCRVLFRLTPSEKWSKKEKRKTYINSSMTLDVDKSNQTHTHTHCRAFDSTSLAFGLSGCLWFRTENSNVGNRRHDSTLWHALQGWYHDDSSSLYMKNIFGRSFARFFLASGELQKYANVEHG